MKECKKRYSSTTAMVRHVRAAHEWDQFRRISYWWDKYLSSNRSTIKLPRDERKWREQSRKDARRAQKQQEVSALKEGKGGRPPKPMRSGRPSASKALLLESINEPNVRQLTRALMERPESDKATPASSKNMQKQSLGNISRKAPSASTIDQVSNAPSSGKATTEIGTMVEFKRFKMWSKG